MAVNQYQKNGKVLWSVYLDLRGRKDTRIRIQKRIKGIKSEREARTEEKKLLRELSEKIIKEESKGITWGELVERWNRYQELYPSKRFTLATLADYVSLVRKWTSGWWDKPVSELSRSDGREIIRQAEENGRKVDFRKKLKHRINAVFEWGLEERLFAGDLHSPVHGMDINPDREEKLPEILSAEEIRELLRRAQEQQHPWYPVWVGAVLTGCRSGELHELRKSDFEIISREQAIAEDKKPFNQRRYGMLRVRRSWNKRARKVGPTKAGYWRTVPVSSEFYWFLVHNLKIEQKAPNDYIFPRFWMWDQGNQAMVLRTFCIGNHLPSVKFHTLRACFATQLISTGIPPSVVMKIAGWRDLKTMQRYIRLAGIDEAGATENLKFVPTEAAVMEKVVNLYDHRNRES